jgi:uncharacterized protein YmfQ (DUF2313 family)
LEHPSSIQVFLTFARLLIFSHVVTKAPHRVVITKLHQQRQQNLAAKTASLPSTAHLFLVVLAKTYLQQIVEELSQLP